MDGTCTIIPILLTDFLDEEVRGKPPNALILVSRDTTAFRLSSIQDRNKIGIVL